MAFTTLSSYSMPSAFVLIPAALVLYIVLVAIYRLTLHPLARYPGPWLAKVSGWPDAISAIRGRRHIDHFLLHCEYGSKVRYAPNSISFNTVEALHDIYGDRNANVVKTGWTEASAYIHKTANLHILSDKQQHAARKRLLSHAFSESALRQAEEYMLSTIRNWCAHLCPDNRSKSDWSESKDMATWSNLLTLDVLGELCFGQSFKGIEAGDHMILDLLILSVKLLQMIAYLPIGFVVWPILRYPAILGTISPKANERKTAFRTKMIELIAERHEVELKIDKEGATPRKDFFHFLLRARDPETGARIEPSELVGEAALLVAAGSDTSSTAMAGCFFYLLRNPAALRALKEEVRGAFSDVEEIRSGTTLSSLRWLRSCIDEAMRMTPPVPGTLPRRVLPGGATIDGCRFEAGTVVGVPIYAIHHNEEYFLDSFTYLPERWIEGAQAPLFDVTQQSLTTSRSAFCPFSLGTRACIGKNMANLELLIGIARVVWLFDFRVSSPADTGGGDPRMMDRGRERTSEFVTQDWLISTKKGPFLQFKKRENLCEA